LQVRDRRAQRAVVPVVAQE